MRYLGLVLACLIVPALTATNLEAQEDLTKQVEELKKQVEALRKAVELTEKSQAETIRRIGQGVERLETQSRAAAPSQYRAEVVGATAQLAAPSSANLSRVTLSPYLNLVRNLDINNNNDRFINLGIDYYLGTKVEQARRRNESLLATDIQRQNVAIQQQGLPATGYRTFFDPNYGRPVRQLYRGR